MAAETQRRHAAGGCRQDLSEIPEGGRKLIVPFRGRAGIGVFNVGGTLYALRNICPHNLGPLCTGHVSGRFVAERAAVAAAAPP